MNERIQQLAKQAGISILYEYDGYDGHAAVANLADIEKFAELIVRECGQYLNSPEFIGRSDLDWSMVLNEHFGVEE